MLFVNTIAQVVHKQIDLYLGAANKNIGDAFLLVWRFPDKFTYIDKDGVMRLKEVFYVNNLADLALIGVIKTIIKLNTNLQILYYRKNEKLNQRMNSNTLIQTIKSNLVLGCIKDGLLKEPLEVDSKSMHPICLIMLIQPVSQKKILRTMDVLI